MNSVGQAYAIIRGRRNGNVEEAKGLLDSIPTAQRQERNRQESRAGGSRRRKKPYKLGEAVRVKNG